MDVISRKADEVDEQEHDGETQIEVALVHEIEAQSEEDRHRYPAEVEEACPKIHECTMVLGKVFVGCNDSGCCGDAEQGFLCLVQILHVDRVYLIVRHNIHPVVGHGKEDERQQGDDQFLGLWMGAEQDGY